MKWHNPEDRLPADGEEVLISANGINFVARYDATLKTFVTVQDEHDVLFPVGRKNLYWTDYVKPPTA